MKRREFLALPLAAYAARLSEFRLGVTSDEIDDDLLTAVRFLREFGLEWAEVRNLWGQYNTSLPEDRIKQARAIMDEHRIRTSVLATAFFKVPLPATDAALDKEWALLESAYSRAEILATKTIRTFAFTYREGEKPDAKAYPRIYELVRESARRARARGYRLALENVGGSYISTAAQAARLLKAVPEDNLGLTWDPNNAGASGERPFPDGYKLLDPARIFHVHLRDFKHTSAGKVDWCAVGEGEMDNLGQLRALRQDGFQGTLTLETHWRSPQGKSHASRTSLGGLLKVIERV